MKLTLKKSLSNCAQMYKHACNGIKLLKHAKTDCNCILTNEEKEEIVFYNDIKNMVNKEKFTSFEFFLIIKHTS